MEQQVKQRSWKLKITKDLFGDLYFEESDLVDNLRVKHKLCTVRELHIYELCTRLLKALKRETGGAKQLYTGILNEEEVGFLQSDTKNPVKIKQNNQRKYEDDT